MIRYAFVVACLPALVAACSSQQVTDTSGPPAPVVLFEGARLIPGDGSAPVEESAFTVVGGAIASIGRKGELAVPAGATRVDLTGKTVMPTLVSAHVHPGFQRGITYSGENYTRETIVNDLNLALYYGVAAVMSQGIERGELAYQIRAEQEAGKLGGGRLLVAG